MSDYMLFIHGVRYLSLYSLSNGFDPSNRYL